jgi:hypothetical protein
MSVGPTGGAGNIPLTRIRLRVPKGVKIEDVVSELKISFEEVDTTAAEINSNTCCVDVALVSPVSTISDTGTGGGGDGA